jgi:AcrR family transcriptional regulator
MGVDLMKKAPSNTRNKILSAAIAIFGSKGEVTTREITKMAGVNVASINYYFGSKNNLLKEVEEYYSELLYGMQDEILNNSLYSPREKLIYWANGLMEFMIKYPVLITLVSSLAYKDISYNPVLLKKFFFNPSLKEKLEEIISQITNIEDEKVLNCKYTQIFSCILGPILFQTISNVYDGERIFFDINKYEKRMEYILDFVDSILN